MLADVLLCLLAMTASFFQRLSVVLQWFNSVLLHDSFFTPSICHIDGDCKLLYFTFLNTRDFVLGQKILEKNDNHSLLV